MHLPILSLVALVATPLAAANIPSKFCDAACRKEFEEARSSEASQWVSQNVTLDPFYKAPEDLSSKAPGTLLRWQNVPDAQLSTNWTIPAGLSLSRFLYVSEDHDGTPVPASAYALLPYSQVTIAGGTNTTRPLNTIVFTHGTAGNIPNCAPSNNKGLYYEWEGPLAMASHGYAVIGPDYAGLGASRPHGLRYMSGNLHAADVAYALIAARSSSIGPHLSKEWVVAGHSEGGMTAWRVNERLAMANQTKMRDAAGEFLGAVAAAPAMVNLTEQVPGSLGSEANPYPMFVFQTFMEAFPNDIKAEDYLTDLALARLPLMNQGCFVTATALFGHLSTKQIFKSTDFLQNPRLVEWQSTWAGSAIRQLAAPMLVLAGEADPVTNTNLNGVVDRACQLLPQPTISYIQYPRLGHDPSFQASQPHMFQWLRERFEGVPLQSGCHRVTVQPLTKNYGTTQIGWTGEGLA
ncbi:hypothetical protein FDECE_12339 [Fusarium decemcellulare]|nr:hypothetical protein FDECE_12339 [Fusarium decemcellulare]